MHSSSTPPLSPGLDAARTCFRTGSLRPGADRGGDQQAEGREVVRDGDGQTRNFERMLGGVGSRLGKGFSDQGSEANDDVKILWESPKCRLFFGRDFVKTLIINVDDGSRHL